MSITAREFDARWERGFVDAAAAWAVAVAPAPVPAHWYAGYEEACSERRRLQDQGEWVRGPSSLMGVLGLRRSEVLHSKVLAWFLDPSGGHRLGARLLGPFLQQVGLGDLKPLEGAEILLEVATVDPLSDRSGSVDIVIKVDGHEILIENKIWSPETNDQLDRYSNAVKLDSTLVFLTPYGARPRRSRGSVERWQLMSWHRDIIRIFDAVARGLIDEGRRVPALDDYVQALKEEFR